MSVCLCVIVFPFKAHLLACVLSYQAINIFVDLFTHFGGQPCRLNFPSVSIGSHFSFYVSAARMFLLLVQYLTLCWPSLPTMHQASLSSLVKLFLFLSDHKATYLSLLSLFNRLAPSQDGLVFEIALIAPLCIGRLDLLREVTMHAYIMSKLCFACFDLVV